MIVTDAPDNPRPRRRWWQHLLRSAALAAVVLVLLYATLPWWLPGRWLAGRVAEDLSRQLGVAVAVDDLAVSWSADGVLTGLRVASPADADGPPLLEAPRVRFSFRPVKLIARGRIDWLTVEGPTLRLRVDGEGQFDLARLGPMDDAVTVDRLLVDGARVSLWLPGEPDRLALTVPHAQFHAGRLLRIEQIALSARLDPPSGPDSPVSLTMRTGSAAGEAQALLKVTFRRLDLAGLGRLGLPVEHLGGVLTGQCELAVNRQGVVEDLRLALSGEGLELQPTDLSGPVRIGRADLRLQGRLAAMDGLFALHRLELTAPGVALVARGRFHASLLAGCWEGVHELALGGRVDPAIVQGLMGGPAGAEIRGPVGVRLNYARSSTQWSGTLDVDASAARLSAGGGVLKPAGEALSVGVAFSGDPRTGRLAIDRAELHLAGNRLAGQGVLADARPLAGCWPDGIGLDGPALLAQLQGQGTCEITNLEALGRLSPALGEALASARLAGTLQGQWRLGGEDGGPMGLSLRLTCDESTQLAVGDWLTKPPGQSAELSLAGAFDVADARLGPVHLELASGPGRLRLDLEPFALSALDGQTLAGTYRLVAPEALAAWLPARVDRPEVLGASELGGRFALQAGAEQARLHITCDAAQAHVHVPGWLDKRAGLPADLSAELLWTARGPRRLDLSAQLPGARLAGWASQDAAPAWRAGLALRVTQADWLRDQLPPLWPSRSWLRVGGGLSAELDLQGDAEALRVQATVDGDQLELARRLTAQHKDRGLPLRLQFQGQWADGTLSVEALSLRAGPVDLTGRGQLGPEVSNLQAELAWRLRVEPALLELLPELGPTVEAWSLTGGADGTLHLQGQAGLLEIAGAVDASALALAGPDGLTKLAGVPAELHFQATRPVDRPEWIVNSWTGQLGTLEGLGAARLGLGEAGTPTGLVAQVRLTTPHAADLVALWPDLAPYRLTGLAEVQTQLRLDFAPPPPVPLARPKGPGAGFDVARAGALTALFAAVPALGVPPALPSSQPWRLDGPSLAVRSVRLDWLGLRAEGLTAEHRGQSLTLDGTLRLDGVELALGGADPLAGLRVERLRTDALRLAGPGGAVTLLADLADWPAGPRGRAELRGSTVDLGVLAGWLGAPLGQWPDPAEPLPDARRAELQRLAEDAIAALRPWAQRADLALAVRLDRLLDYPDGRVRTLCDIEALTVEATLAEGQLALAYTGGLNGGTLHDVYTTDLRLAEPVVTLDSEARQLLGGPALDPHVQAVFPGNEVRGQMSRTMHTQTPLVGVIAQSLDGRYPAVAVGHARAEFVDGVTRGKAAPSFVTRLLPGLDLVEYPYASMVCFSEFRPDGSAYNDMVFSGRVHDLYIEGTTDAAGWGDYEIGVILLGSPQSPQFNHRYRQGRVPVLKWQARIVGGQRADETVSYPWPNETVFAVFLKNNLFYRLWLQRQQ